MRPRLSSRGNFVWGETVEYRETDFTLDLKGVLTLLWDSAFFGPKA